MTTALQLIGAGLITAGATLIYPAAGFIVGGTFAILVGLAIGRK